MGENVSVKIEGGGGKGCYLYIVKIENFHPVLTSSLKGIVMCVTCQMFGVSRPNVMPPRCLDISWISTPESENRMYSKFAHCQKLMNALRFCHPDGILFTVTGLYPVLCLQLHKCIYNKSGMGIFIQNNTISEYGSDYCCPCFCYRQIEIETATYSFVSVIWIWLLTINAEKCIEFKLD